MREYFNFFILVLNRDLQIYLNKKSDWLSTLLFFVIAVCMFPFAFGPLPSALSWLIPGIIWTAALLASILAQENIFKLDYQLEIFQQCIVSKNSLSLLIFAKTLANWLVTGLPLVVLGPILAFSFGLPLSTILILALSLLLGTPFLSLIGAIGAALVVALPRGGLLLAIIILPLYIPVLVLATAACVLSLQGIDSFGQLSLLAAMSVAALLFAPLAASVAVRASIA